MANSELFSFFIKITAITLLYACSSSSTTEKAEKDKPIIYKEVEPSQTHESCKIGGQTWMAQNLNEPHFKNGDPITEAKSAEEWKKAGNIGKPAWCYYNNDPAMGAIYGKLYNWYAVNDPRGLAPAGWHVPTLNEVDAMSDYLGGGAISGGKLKTTGTSLWQTPNKGATNSSGFSAIPAGTRGPFGNSLTGTFGQMGFFTYMWTTTIFDQQKAQPFACGYNIEYLAGGATNKKAGLSIRCVKD